jgi:hypothetical protein
VWTRPARVDLHAGGTVRRLILAATLAGLAIGCADRVTAARAHRAQFPVEVGMTAQDVLERWGRPAEVLRIRTSDGGVTEEWRYHYGSLADNGGRARIPVFVWLRDGRVMATLE